MRYLCIAVLLYSCSVYAVDFESVSLAASGLTNVPSWSMLFFDCNGDGYTDMLRSQQAQPSPLQMFVNNGNNTFSLLSLSSGWRGVVWGDADNDGGLDLASRHNIGNSPNLLTNLNNGSCGADGYNEESLQFINSESLMFVDIDGDGDLDLWEPGQEALWHRNDGTSWTRTVQLPGDETNRLSNGEGSTAMDLNADGYVDLVYVYGGLTRVWMNDGAYQYTYFANGATSFGLPSNAGSNYEDLDFAWGDCDSDGDMDLFLSGNIGVGFYKNENGTFVKDATVTIINTKGADWGDADNDGDLDLIVAKDANSVLFLNDGNCVLSLNDPAPTLAGTVGWIDTDNDGDLDLISTRGNFWLNQLYDTPQDSGYLRVRAVGLGGEGNSPKTPFGAKINLRSTTGSQLKQHREMISGSNKFQPAWDVHFGAGTFLRYDIEVIFPSQRSVIKAKCGQQAQSYIVEESPTGTMTEVGSCIEDPIILAPAQVTVSSGVESLLSGINVQHSSLMLEEVLEVKLSTTIGEIQLETASYFQFSEGSGNWSTSMVFTGTIQDIQMAVGSHLYFRGPSPALLDIVVNDSPIGDTMIQQASVQIVINTPTATSVTLSEGIQTQDQESTVASGSLGLLLGILIPAIIVVVLVTAVLAFFIFRKQRERQFRREKRMISSIPTTYETEASTGSNIEGEKEKEQLE